MSVKNFIPALWNGALLAHLDKAHVIANLVNRDYAGEISQYGDRVKIFQVSDLTISDYTGAGVTYGDLDTTEIELIIDEKKYFSFKVDDVDSAQVRSNGALMDGAMQRASYALANETEKDIFTAMKTGTQAHTASATLSASNVYEELVAVKVKMDKNNVPTQGRYMVVSPELHGLLLQDARFATGGSMAEDAVKNGFVGRILGFEVFVSNNVKGASDKVEAVLSVPMSTTFAEQIVQTEALRLEGSFADAVRGLNVYGVKVTQPTAVFKLVNA